MSGTVRIYGISMSGTVRIYGISESFKGCSGDSKGSEGLDGSVGSNSSWGSGASGFSSWLAMDSWGLSKSSSAPRSGLETSIGSFSWFSSPSAEKHKQIN